MSLWRPRLERDARLKYLAIVEALEADIHTGRVHPGDRLPAQRSIAEVLGVDLTTVTRALNEARRRGLVDAHAGRGTFIREGVASQQSAGSFSGTPLLDLSMNIPPQPVAADLRRRIPAGIADLLSSPRGMLHLHYQESTGSDPDRTAAADWLEQRVGAVAPGRILVAGGAQSALFAICEYLAKPGDAIAAGALTYPGLKAVAQQRGLVLEPILMDAEGIVPDAFDQCCRRAPPKAIYIVPAMDNPTTATLNEGRRRKIVEIAHNHGVAIIEDDPYSPLSATGVTALAAMASDLTWHIATLSKCVTPALRVAYIVAPGNTQARRLAGILRATNLMAPPLNAALASRWIADGTLASITTAIREENAERQKLAASILRGSSFSADPFGHHLWLRLPQHWRATDFAEHADRSGVAIVPSSAFSITVQPPEAVRISLGVAPDRAALEDALTLLASLIDQPSLATRAVV